MEDGMKSHPFKHWMTVKEWDAYQDDDAAAFDRVRRKYHEAGFDKALRLMEVSQTLHRRAAFRKDCPEISITTLHRLYPL
jgi:hypothetical protein